MDVPKVAPRSAAAELAGLLDSPEIAHLIGELEATRWTGRPGYPLRSMVGMALAKSMYCIPTWTRTARLVAEHAALIPMHRALRGDWEDVLHREDARGRRRVVRMIYEVATFQALREALRCKEIWVVGADRWRNPDEDLPHDYEQRHRALPDAAHAA